MAQRERLIGQVVKLGQVVMTQGVSILCEEQPFLPLALLARHKGGDWGDTCDEDWDTNNWSLLNGERIVSVYKNACGTGETVWVITERDRSSTTLLLPSEY